MTSLKRTCIVRTTDRQRGAVLFIALIALVTIMLAAVALVRSVDTATSISGNLAFKQAATTSGDAGLESAISWLAQTDQNNTALKAAADAAHPFNNDNQAVGYYSNADEALNLTDETLWADANRVGVVPGADASGNSLRYVIQRMCRQANQLLSAENCLFSDAPNEGDSDIEISPEKNGPRPLYRVTVRSAGPRNTVSYIQAFVY